MQCLLAGVCIAGMVLPQDKSFVCKAAGAGNADFGKMDAEKADSGEKDINEEDTAEIEAFVTAFYEAHTQEGMGSLKEYIDNEESLELYLRRMEISFTYGVIRYDNIDVLVYPLQDGYHWLAAVNYDLVVGENEIALPGAVVQLVRRKEDDSLVIYTNEQNFTDVSEEVLEEVRRIVTEDEIAERMAKQDAGFEDVCEEYPEALEWAYDLSNALMAVQSEYYEEDTKKDSKEAKILYTVQKGDCLWYIAERKFGDGMRWNEIYRDNRNVIGDDPDLLYVGLQLQLAK